MSSYITRLVTANRNVARLRQLSARNAKPEDLTEVLRETLKFVPLRATTLVGEELFRSRWCEPDRLFTHLDELKYPNADRVKEKNRLNDVGESILYAAFGELGSIIESRPELARLFTISMITRKNDAPLYFVPIGVTGKPYSQAPSNALEALIVAYLHEEITKAIQHREEYNSTIALGHFFMREKIKDLDEVDRLGIIYPSAHGKKICSDETYNVAITPAMFDASYQILKTSVCCLTNETVHYQLNLLNEGLVPPDGAVDWKFDFLEMRERIRKGLDVHDKVVENIKSSAAFLAGD